jgi:hypothetical protein
MEPLNEKDVFHWVGRLMEASATLDENIEHCLRACVNPPLVEALTPFLAKLSFHQQVQILQALGVQLYGAQDAEFVELNRWCKLIERIRARRNALVYRVLRNAAEMPGVGDLRAEVTRVDAECIVAVEWARRLELRTGHIVLARSLGDRLL